MAAISKVVHILLGKANPHKQNGVNVVVHHLASAMLQTDINAEVWGISHSPNISHHHAYKLIVFRKSYLRFLVSLKMLRAIVRERKTTIFHLHSVFLPELFVVGLFLSATGHRYIYTPHGQLSERSFSSFGLLKRLYYRCFDSVIINNASALHAISEIEADFLSSEFPNSRVYLILNGGVLAEAKWKPNHKELIFGYCGRLAQEQKGLDVLVEAFIEYKELGGVGCLEFIGDGQDRQDLEDRCMVAAQNGKSVRFLGPLFGPKKESTLLRHSCFCHPSRWEGFPTSILEAAGLGLPLLVSEDTGAAEVVRKYNAGIVIPTGYQKSLVDALFDIERRYDSGELEDFSQGSREMISEELNWGVASRKFRNLFMVLNE